MEVLFCVFAWVKPVAIYLSDVVNYVPRCLFWLILISYYLLIRWFLLMIKYLQFFTFMNNQSSLRSVTWLLMISCRSLKLFPKTMVILKQPPMTCIPASFLSNASLNTFWEKIFKHKIEIELNWNFLCHPFVVCRFYVSNTLLFKSN